jgi:tetratricopeptide (TPR) repeat protein
MPFGEKKDENGNVIDFDKVYEEFIKLAIEDSGLEPIRADEEQAGGIIHKPMYERLMLCEYAVADLSTANANVFYELGISHSIRPHSTISIFASDSSLPFDVKFLRALPYDRKLENLDELKKELTSKLLAAKKEPVIDSPLFQLVDGIQASNIEHIKTDVFRERVNYSKSIKDKLFKARNSKNKEELKNIESSLNNLADIEAGVIIDLFLSYRSLEAFEEMINFVDKMPQPLQQTVMVQEQLGFALNRLGDRKKAISVLEDVINKHGKSSETCGILGRVYKDLWGEHKSNDMLSKGYLNKAIKTYLDGFESDFRDAYPGINAVALMDIAGDNRKDELIPVVRYAVKQKMKSSVDYWDYATLLELAVLENNQEKAINILPDVLSNARESWETKTTADNLRYISQRRDGIKWIENIIYELTKTQS